MESDAQRSERRAAISKRIIEQVEQLPPMPQTALRLRHAASSPTVDFAALVPLIEQDPGLCADLLHFANSAAYGVRRHVETVGEAVLYFGMDNLTEFILLSYSNRLLRESFGKLQCLKDFFTHSEQVSLACFLLAQQAGLNRHDQEVSKVTGLLHNVGKLVIYLATQQWGARLLGASWRDRQALMNEEESLYGLNHCEVGVLLCRKWQFPEKILEGIVRHHTPVKGDDVSVLGAYVYLGELLVIDDLPFELVERELPEAVMNRLGLSSEKLKEARKQYAHVCDHNPRTRGAP